MNGLGEVPKQSLLAWARHCLVRHLIRTESPSTPPDFDLKAGVFVTLTRAGQLRGCIGRVEPQRPVVSLIQEMVISAATRDPRFPPVVREELEELRVEISLLGALEECSLDEVVVGVHGLTVDVDGKRGLLLPQVAIERAWSVEEFLKATCRKAGVDEAELRRRGRLQRFCGLHFSEDQ